jgi:hypothetical protein
VHSKALRSKPAPLEQRWIRNDLTKIDDQITQVVVRFRYGYDSLCGQMRHCSGFIDLVFDRHRFDSDVVVIGQGLQVSIFCRS